MKAVIKFFVYLGLISLILYLSGCFYHDSWENNGRVQKTTAEKTAETPTEQLKKETNQINALTEETANVVLYFANSDGYLTAEKREISPTRGVARQTMLELIRGPQNEKLWPTIPEQTQLLDIGIRDGLCTVNFSSHLQSHHSGGSAAEENTVYAIVNTLTQFSSVDRVMILIDGAQKDSLAGHFDLRHPLERDGDLIRAQ